MFKFIKKRVSLGGGTKGKADVDGKDVPVPPQQVKFEINDQNASRLSDLFEVAVRTKLSDRSSDPLAMTEDETTEHLVEEFLQKKTSKADYESYSANTLWSAAIAILNMEDRILSSEACEAIKNATSEGITKLAGDLPLPAQKVLGIVFAAAEMLIRDEPHCAPMVLNVLSKTLVWALPPSTYVATNALVNLVVDHRRLFPSCHTFARKISSTVSPVSAGEWRAFCASSVAVYGQPSSATESGGQNHTAAAGGAAASGTGAGGDTNSEHSGEDASYVTAPSVSEVQGSARDPASRLRVSYTSDLPLNDVNASASIDVASLRRTAQAPQEESKQGSVGAGIAANARSESKSSSNSNSSSNSRGSATGEAQQRAEPGGAAAGGAGGGNLSIRDLQGVFSSSLVSSASLDYLSISSIMDDDYADIRTLSGAIKWILQSQQLSDAVTGSRGEGAQKGIVSWREFLALAQPFLTTADAEYLRSPAGAKVAYDAAVPDFSAPRAEAKGTGSGGWQQASSKALLASKSRSRQGFGGAVSDASSEEDEEDAKSRRAPAKGSASAAPTTKQAAQGAQGKEGGGGKSAGAGHWSRNRTAVAREEPEEPEATLSDVDELDLSNGGITPVGRGAQPAAASRGPVLNKNINARRNDWDEQSEGSDEDGISISSSNLHNNKNVPMPAAAGRRADPVKGAAGTSRVFDLDLLDDAVSAPAQRGSAAGARGGAEAPQPGLGERDLHNSFDDEEEGSRGGADTEEEEETPRPGAGAHAAPLSGPSAATAAARREHAATASFVSDTDSSSGLYRLSAGTADAASRAQRDSGASGSAADAVARNSTGSAGAGAQPAAASIDPPAEQQPADASVLDVSRLTTTSAAGSEISASDQAAIKQKSALKKAAKGAKNFLKGVFSLTSTSSNNSQASGSVSNASPARSRLNSADSNDPSAGTITGSADGEARTQDNTRRNSEPAAVEQGGGGGVFARMKARFSRGRSDSRESASGIPDSVGDSGSVGSPSSPHTPTPTLEPSVAAAGPAASEPSSTANSAKYSVGIAEAADTGAPQQGAVPPQEAQVPVGDGAPPIGRMVHSDSTASAGSVASSTHTAGTGVSAGSTASGKKKKAPSLKGMVHKSYKVMFGAGGKAKQPDASPAGNPSPVPLDSPSETPRSSGHGSAAGLVSAGDQAVNTAAASTSDMAPAPAPVPAPARTPSTTLVPPPKPQKLQESQLKMAVPDESAAPALPKSDSPAKPPKPVPLSVPSSASAPQPPVEHKASSPPKPPKRPSATLEPPALASARPATHIAGDVSECTPLDDAPHSASSQAEHKTARHAPGPPSTPSIYQTLPVPVPVPVPAAEVSTESAPAASSAAASHASEPAPEVPSTALPPLAHAPSATDVSSAADGTITAERKLSNPALKRASFKLSSLFAFGGSKTSSRSSSRVPSRSNSFSGDAAEPAATSPGPARSDTSQPDTPIRQVPSNGTGLASLLRGNTQRAPSPTAKAGQAGQSGPTRADLSSAYSPDRTVLDRCAEVLERSRLRTAALHAKLSQQPAAQSTALSVPVDIRGDMDRIRAAKRQQGRNPHEGIVDPLLQDWQLLLARREPKCLRLSADERKELRSVAERNLAGNASQQDKEREAQVHKEEALHLLLQRQLSRVPDPLFGLALHQRGATALARPASARLSSGEVERLVAEDVMHSELDLALGVKFAGHLSRVVSRFWRKRYFMLVVEPLINPNLHLMEACGVCSDVANLPSEEPGAPVVVAAGAAAAEMAAESVKPAAPHPQKLAYYLLEYARCVDSKWGHCPVQLLRRYAIADVLALRTDSKASKHGLEFSVILRRPDPPEAANKPVPAPAAPTASTSSVSAHPHKDTTQAGIGKTDKSGNKFASLVLHSQGKIADVATATPTPSADAHQNHTTAAGDAAAGASTTEGTASPAEPSAPPQEPKEAAAAAEEEEPVVRTRWNRLLKKSQSAGAPSGAPAADAPSTATTTDLAPAAAVQGNAEHQGGDAAHRARSSSTATAATAATALPSAPEPEQQGDHDVASETAGDAQSEAGQGEEDELSDGEGDYAFLAAGAAGQGAGGQSLTRKQLRKLKLRAATPDDRLQWVQILHAVAGHALHSNNTSY